jgi:hypothetical protein
MYVPRDTERDRVRRADAEAAVKRYAEASRKREVRTAELRAMRIAINSGMNDIKHSASSTSGTIGGDASSTSDPTGVIPATDTSAAPDG